MELEKSKMKNIDNKLNKTKSIKTKVELCVLAFLVVFGLFCVGGGDVFVWALIFGESAQYKLAEKYVIGEGRFVEKSPTKAAKWYYKAAKGSDVCESTFGRARRELADCYYYGVGVRQSYEMAVRLYHELAGFTVGGVGVVDKAVRAEAYYNLGFCYYNGLGVERSHKNALLLWDWLEKEYPESVFAHVSKELISWLERWEANGKEVNVERLREKAKEGDAEAQYIVSRLYFYGPALHRRDLRFVSLGAYCDKKALDGFAHGYHQEAEMWLRKAAEQGYVFGQSYLGWCYYYGWGVEQSYEKAVKLFWKAEEQGDVNAQYGLALCYEEGKGVAKSQEGAVKWYRKAAEQGHSGAQCGLGRCYEEGEGIEKSYAEAAKWYRKAAEQGDVNAQYGLALCYEGGKGVAKSREEAVKWYRKAAEQGHKGALISLRLLCF